MTCLQTIHLFVVVAILRRIVGIVTVPVSQPKRLTDKGASSLISIERRWSVLLPIYTIVLTVDVIK